MKWPWQRKLEREVATDEIDRTKQAKQARQRAEQDLKKIRENREEVEHIADRLREIRKQNHLAEIFAESIKKRQTDG